MIGLGFGRTTVEAHVQVYQDTLDGQHLLEGLANVEADAKRLAGKVAGELKSFFEDQGWIP